MAQSNERPQSGVAAFVAEVERILKRRQEETREGRDRRSLPQYRDTREGLEKWTFDELYHEYGPFRDMRKNPDKYKRPPTSADVREVAELLLCTFEERNGLLIAAGYAPEDEEPEGDALLKALDTGQRILDYLPLPAYVVTRDDVIQRWNSLVPTLFFFGRDELKDTPEEQRNVLRYIFDRSTPVYDLLTNFSKDFSWWQYTAKLNVYRFKKDNILSRNKHWYRERVESLMVFPEFKTIWNTMHVDTGIEEIIKEMPERVPFPEYVTKMYTPDKRGVKVRGLQMRVVDTDFPRIVAYIPDDQQSIDIFTELGIPTPDNVWGHNDLPKL